MAKALGRKRVCGVGGRALTQNQEEVHPVVEDGLRVVSPPMVMGETQRVTAPVPDFGGSSGTVLRKSPRPSGCSRFVRREIADAMPSICAMLLTRVMDGDLSSLKLLLQMASSGRSAETEGQRRTSGFGRKILRGFQEFEARESGLRRES